MKVTSKKQTDFNQECSLIKTVYKEDDYGSEVIDSEEIQSVFCGIFSVSGNEFYEAAKEGMKAEYGIIINSVEDNNADAVEIYNNRYLVYRRYVRIDGYTELYLRGE